MNIFDLSNKLDKVGVVTENKSEKEVTPLNTEGLPTLDKFKTLLNVGKTNADTRHPNIVERSKPNNTKIFDEDYERERLQKNYLELESKRKNNISTKTVNTENLDSIFEKILNTVIVVKDKEYKEIIKEIKNDQDEIIDIVRTLQNDNEQLSKIIEENNNKIQKLERDMNKIIKYLNNLK